MFGIPSSYLLAVGFLGAVVFVVRGAIKRRSKGDGIASMADELNRK